jgi:hypothetical protein
MGLMAVTRAAGDEASHRSDGNKNQRHSQHHPRVTRAALDPAGDQPIQTQAQRQSLSDSDSNAGSGR